MQADTLLINLVGTRCVDGDHAALLHWYADHAHMLMGFAGLHGAVLLRGQGDATASAPQYLALYDFASSGAFEAYEASALRAEVEQDRQRGWGRDGIQIVMRTQYRRLYRRRAGAAGTEPSMVHVEAWRSAGEPSSTTERALAARAEGSAAFALHRTQVWPSQVADYLALTTPGAHALAAEQGVAPSGLDVAWQGNYRPLLNWER